MNMNNSNFDISNNVVLANEFIEQTSTILDTVPLKIFRMAISSIDVNNPSNIVYINRKDILTFLHKNNTDTNYGQIKNIITHELLSKVIEMVDNEKKIYTFTPFSGIIYPNKTKNENITFIFSPYMFPYIIQLKEKFLQYNICNIKNFNSKHSILIYEYLLVQERKNRANNHLYTISVETLRYITRTTDKYKVFKDFERRVIVPAVTEINSGGVEFLIKYNKVKESNKVVSIDFQLRVRTDIFEKQFEDVKHPEWLKKEI